MKYLFITLGVLSGTFLLIVYSAFSWGYVATIFYEWYILSVFPNLPTFTWVQFAGFMFIVNCFVHPSQSHIKDEYVNQVSYWSAKVLAPWFLLLLGWAFHKFIY